MCSSDLLRPRPAIAPGSMTTLRSKMIKAYKASLLGRFLKFESSPPNPEPRDFVEDERERHERDHACYQAWGWIVLIALFLSSYLDPIELDKMHLSAEQLTDLLHGLSLAALILAFTLPQSIILWTEPDMEEPR